MLLANLRRRRMGRREGSVTPLTAGACCLREATLSERKRMFLDGYSYKETNRDSFEMRSHVTPPCYPIVRR